MNTDSIIDKLKQLEKKKLLSMVSNPNLWVYFISKEPLCETCTTVLGNYTLTLSFNHPTKDYTYKQDIITSSGAVHVLNGTYEINVGEVKIMVEDKPAYYSFSGTSTILLKPIKDVCATFTLEEKIVDLYETAENDAMLARKEVMLEWFKNLYRYNTQEERVEENRIIKRGDYVVVDENIIDDYNKKKVVKYLGQKGFVIKVERTMVDIRFGSERTQIQSRFLRISGKDDVVNKAELKQRPKKKVVDDMNPDNWED